ncbi:MAG: hypothetical protein IKV99_01555 [Oscillospiraceae bacterium]|nr:hypothetical protein [Oscillospiraceae bacterium]
MKKLDGRQKVELLLLLIAIIAWLLRKLEILYIPGLAGLTLGVALGMVGVNFIAQKDKSKKLAGVLILAFGLLNIVVAFLEVTVLRGA